MFYLYSAFQKPKDTLYNVKITWTQIQIYNHMIKQIKQTEIICTRWVMKASMELKNDFKRL